MTASNPSDSLSQERSQDKIGKKVKLVTVHGTGAGDTTATGNRWWQHGSAFMKELHKRLKIDSSRVELAPFQWDQSFGQFDFDDLYKGPNSAQSRRRSGKELLKQLQSYDRSGTDYYLIAHSHGGSVVYNALLYSVSQGAPLERLKCWCTVGTPFLDYRANTFLFQRLGSLGLTIYLTGMGA